MDDIIYVKVKERNIEIRTESRYIEGSITNQLDTILSRYGFARINQNAIVNLNKIKSYDSELGVVYFDDEKLDECQVSRRNRHKISTYYDNLR